MYSNRDGFSLDAVAALRARELAHGAVIVGANVAVSGMMPHGGLCVVPPAPARCAFDFPSFTSLALLSGLEGRFGSTARVLVGPAVFDGEHRRVALGFQGRADLASPPLLHMSIVASARGELIPNFEGRLHAMTGFGVGVRIQ